MAPIYEASSSIEEKTDLAKDGKKEKRTSDKDKERRTRKDVDDRERRKEEKGGEEKEKENVKSERKFGTLRGKKDGTSLSLLTGVDVSSPKRNPHDVTMNRIRSPTNEQVQLLLPRERERQRQRERDRERETERERQRETGRKKKRKRKETHLFRHGLDRHFLSSFLVSGQDSVAIISVSIARHSHTHDVVIHFGSADQFVANDIAKRTQGRGRGRYDCHG